VGQDYENLLSVRPDAGHLPVICAPVDMSSDLPDCEQVLRLSRRSALASLAARAAAALMPIAWRLGFALQGIELIPGLQLIAIKRIDDVLVLVIVHEHHYPARKRNHINDLAFAPWRDHPFICAWELLAGLHILFVLIDQAAAQSAAHAGDLSGVNEMPCSLAILMDMGLKSVRELGAAACLEAAGAHAAQDLGDIPRADLP